MPERDPNGLAKPFLGYSNGPRGLEPKLKFKIKYVEGLTAADLTLEKIVDHIILGPSRSSGLVEGSAKRMLEKAGKLSLINNLKVSGIPYRSFG